MAFNHTWQALLRPGASSDFFASAKPGRFDPAAAGFSPTNAWWLSELSRLIYRKGRAEPTDFNPPSSAREAFLQKVGLRENCFFYTRHAQAALVETVADSDRAFAVLVFRGTSGPLSNWFFNLNATPATWPGGGRVHRGFKSIFLGAWQEIAGELQRVRKPLFYTGHSLGGALATLAAACLPPQAVYTFGAPRVGDADFVAVLKPVRIFHIVNPNDLVTALPPKGKGLRFAHAGEIHPNPAPQPSQAPFGGVPEFLAQHAPCNYTAQLPLPVRR
ncbi:MAG: lipase family protein [Desulfobacterales bacterium]|nr:lipase family protein [Desulfobacterales bacterium]